MSTILQNIGNKINVKPGYEPEANSS
jgi:hypothetical protein